MLLLTWLFTWLYFTLRNLPPGPRQYCAMQMRPECSSRGLDYGIRDTYETLSVSPRGPCVLRLRPVQYYPLPEREYLKSCRFLPLVYPPGRKAEERLVSEIASPSRLAPRALTHIAALLYL